MLNDYKPTHDPNIDTFKVEYLLGGAAVLAIVFPNRFIYSPSEVNRSDCDPARIRFADIKADSVDVFDLAGGRGHPTTAIHAAAYRRG